MKVRRRKKIFRLGRMGNDHLSRRSSPTASTSVAKRLGKVASFSVSPEGHGGRGLCQFRGTATSSSSQGGREDERWDETEEWKGVPPVPSLFVPEKLQSRLISASKSSTIHAIGRNP